ncbi:MAG: hypothetical protein U0175_20400 [Caldilineaceae bacterium]
MQISQIQQLLRQSEAQMANPFRSPAEVMLTITEELGEVAKEVSLLERIGSKAGWEREPSRERLSEELLHLLNMMFVLGNRYDIDLDAAYRRYWNDEQR